MPQRRRKVTLTTDLDALAAELAPQPMLLVRPLYSRKYTTQRTLQVAEVVDLATLNLALVESFETH
ncbi:MAG TPA: hypothetical protein PLZ36_02380 [Armatimonadota bacterium]|nr:hypothetical protein [Armatimonadota bacterium]HOS42544.1 hypothetical protein [Armatimonadota bacterium]